MNKKFTNVQTQLGNIQKRISKYKIEIISIEERYGLRKIGKIRKIKAQKFKKFTGKERRRLFEKGRKSDLKIEKKSIKVFKKMNKLRLQSSQRFSKASAYSSSSLRGKVNIRGRKLTGIKELRKELEKISKFKKAINRARMDKLISSVKASSMLAKAKSLEKALKILSKSKSKQALKSAQILVSDKVKALKSATVLLKDNIKVLSIKTISTTIIRPPVIPKPPIPRPPRPRPPKKKIVPIIRRKKKKAENTKRLSKTTQLYKVYAKKRGRNILIGSRLTKQDAKNFMAYEADNSLLRSVVPKRDIVSKIARKLPTKYSGSYERLKRKFRKVKIKSKKKIPIKGMIEKNKYILDTKIEKAQLKKLRDKAKKKTSKTKK